MPPRFSNPYFRAVALLIFFLGAAILFTWPTVSLWDSAIPGYTWTDEGLFYWNSWLVQRWLWEGEPLWRVDVAYPPDGLLFFANTHSFLYGLIAALLSPLIPLAAGYNLVIIYSFTLSSLVCYWVARRFELSAAGSLAASLVFSFSAHRMSHVAGHLNLIGVEMLPLALLPALQIFQRAAARITWRRHIIDGVICTAGFIYTAYISYYIAFYFGLLAIFGTMAALCTRPIKQWFALLGWRFLLTWLVAGAISAATLWPIVATWKTMANEWEELPTQETYTSQPGIDLSTLLIPPHRLMIWKVTGMGTGIDWRSSAIEEEAYLGWGSLILIMAAFGSAKTGASNRRRLAFCSLLSLAFLLLALGAGINWNGKVFPLALPYGMIDSLPLFENFRAAGRLMMVVALPFGLIAGSGLEQLLIKLKSQRKVAVFAISLISLVFILETTYYLEQSSFEDPVSVPQQALERIRDSPAEGRAVLMPILESGAQTNVYQTIHERDGLFAQLARINMPLQLALARHRTGLLVDPDNFDPEATGPDDFMREGQVAGTILRRTCSLFQIRWIILAPVDQQQEMLLYLQERLPIKWVEIEPDAGLKRWVVIEIGDLEKQISQDNQDYAISPPRDTNLETAETLVLAHDSWKTSPYDIDSAIGRGWTNGWIVGNKIRLLFYLEPEQVSSQWRADLLLKGFSLPPKPGTNIPQSAWVSLNGITLRNGLLYFLPQPKEQEVYLPDNLFREGWNELELEFQQELRPTDNDPDSIDDSILSFYVQLIAIRWSKESGDEGMN